MVPGAGPASDCASAGVTATPNVSELGRKAHYWNTLHFSRSRVTVAGAPAERPRPPYGRTGTPHGIRDLQQRVRAAPVRGAARCVCRTRPHHGRDRLRRGRRQGRVQVRLGHRAPLPHDLLPPLGQRVVSRLRGRPHGQHPPRLGHLQHHAAGEPPGPRRRTGGHARPPLRGAVRVRHRPRLVDHRAEGLRHRRLRAHPGDGGRDPPADRAHVEGRGLQLRRQILLHAGAQRAPQALLQASPAHLDGGRLPLHLRPGGGAGRRRAVLRLLHPGSAHSAGEPLQGEDRRTARTPSAAS